MKMTKDIKQIQEENRRYILEAIHGCSYEEALEKELGLGCIITREEIGMWGHFCNTGFWKIDNYQSTEQTMDRIYFLTYVGWQELYCGWVSKQKPKTLFLDKANIKEELETKRIRIIGKPITLSRVLLALKDIKIYGQKPIICLERSNIVFEEYDEDGSRIEFLSIKWDLKKETLEEQEESTQIAVNELLTTNN